MNPPTFNLLFRMTRWMVDLVCLAGKCSDGGVEFGVAVGVEV